MKKLGIALSVSICVLVYLFIENSHLKNEIRYLKEDEAVEGGKSDLHIGVAENAEAFIKAYFTYSGKPNQEEVEPYATSKALDKLQFGEPEGLEGENDEEIESIISDVKNVNVYLGKSSNDRQKVAVIFDNEIAFNKIKSTASTIMELDMIMDDDVWKVDNFTFNQF